MADETPNRRKTEQSSEDNREVREENRRDDKYNRRSDGNYRSTNPVWAWFLAIIGILILLALLWLAFGNRYLNINQTQINQNTNQNQSEFAGENKTSNFDQSIPSHQDVVPAAPIGVVVQTNTVNTMNSSVIIDMDGTDYGTGNTILEANSTDLRRMMDPNAPDGIYTVNYSSCSEDGSCQKGSYQFKIDSSLKIAFDDLTNQRNVSVSINNNQFNPDKIIITKGTHVTWANNNNSEIEIGPGIKNIQNFVKTFSSGKLPTGQNISFTFSQAGYYPIIVFSNGQMIIGQIIVQ